MATQNIILKAGDSLNVTAEATIPVPPVNKLPLVNVGIDQQIKLPVSEVTLTGEVSDSDGTIQKLQWEKVSGVDGVIVTPTARITKATGLKEGSYVFKLTATDDKNGSTSASLRITVLPADVITPPGKVPYLTLPVSAKKNFSGQSNVIIENLRFENISGAAIVLTGCNNITIRNCFFNKASEEAISVEGCNNVLVEKNLFNGVASGVYGLSSSNIRVVNNQSVNPHVRPQGGRGNLVQFNGVGGSNDISNNKSESFTGEGNPEDHISLYNTSNVTVKNNILRGGGPSDSGSGIMTGDNGGGNQVVEGNKLVNTGNAGIGVAGGNGIQILNNQIYSERTSVSNNPLYAWAQAGASMSNIVVKGNKANWTDKNGNKNGGWNAGNGTNISFEYPPTISLAEMNVPSHLIDFITPDELLKIRGK